MSALTLTRDEASAISGELQWTCGNAMFLQDVERGMGMPSNGARGGDSEDVEAAIDYLQEVVIHRLRLEMAVRDSCGWWNGDAPCHLDLMARWGEGECPDRFVVNADAAAALREFCALYLTDFLADVDEAIGCVVVAADLPDLRRHRAGLASLASRFGVAEPEAVTT